MPNAKIKPIILLDIFRRYTDSEHRLSVPEIVKYMSDEGIAAERKGIYRDIDALVEAGFDIVKSRTGYYLKSRKYETAEIKLLVSAIEAAVFITPERTHELTEKLLCELNDYAAANLRMSAGIGSAKYGSDEVLSNIELIDNAIQMRRQIRFTYFKRDVNRRNVFMRSGNEYRVSPYAMIWRQDRYYLVSNMESRDDLTHFRLDRIHNAVIDVQPWRHFSEVSEYKTKFDSMDYARKCVNMFGGEIKNVVMRCKASVASDVFDRFADAVTIVREQEGKFLATVRVAAGIGFLSWAVQFADSVEIVSPPELRNEMRERLKSTLRQYEKR